MERQAVHSKAIKSIGHDPATQTLEVEFLTGKVYLYHEFPTEKFRELLAAESLGKYMGKNVLGKHKFTMPETEKK